MTELIFDTSGFVSQWVAHRTNGAHPHDNISFGVLRNGVLIAAATFHTWEPASVCIAIAADDPRFARRSYFAAGFDYVFNVCGRRRVMAFISSANERSIRFARKLGMTLEGTLRSHAPDGSDVLIFGLLAEECRFLKDPSDAVSSDPAGSHEGQRSLREG